METPYGKKFHSWVGKRKIGGIVQPQNQAFELSCDSLFDEKMQSLALFLAAAAAVGSALAQDCPFYPGTCPVNVDNVVEVMLPS